MPDDERDGRPEGALAVVRRAPFSDNPLVGARGQRTQQRILDAALRAFGEQGYHACSIDHISKLARCSRVSFYQYFANKEDVFRQLAGQVARQVSASTETLDPLTPDGKGWDALRAWVARYAEIHARYEPVFHALRTDEALEVVARHTGEETVVRIHARLATTLAPRHLDPVIRLLLQCMNHTFDVGGVLRSVLPDAYPSERIEVAVTDVMHRTLFGVQPDVNVHPPDGPRAALESASAILALLAAGDTREAEGSGTRTLDALLALGRDVFLERGYHNTRVDDLVAAAGISRGAFYRYFRNKDDLARVLTARAVQTVGRNLAEIPDLFSMEPAAANGVLRRWLIRYHAAQYDEAGMLRVWVDAALQDPVLKAEFAPLYDWGRRSMAGYLQPRGFGDPDTDALVAVALLSEFGSRQRPAAEVDAAAAVIERGLLGR